MGRNDPFLGPWTWEATSVIGSALCLAVQISLLAAYDGKPVFTWHGVTLNTIVSVLSTAGKASLLFAVEELVSQWKWILFTDRARPLMDFERIDSASRGPLGSLQLLWNGRETSVLRIAALMMLLDAAIDPFSQQLVQYRQDTVYTDDMDTVIARAVRYSKGNECWSPQVDVDSLTNSVVSDPNETLVLADADFSMQSAVLYGLDRPLDSVIQQRSVRCSTGNCTWPTHESLAVCNRCINLDDKLERFDSDGYLWVDLSMHKDNGITASKNESTGFRLPNGLFLENLRGWVYNEPLDDGKIDAGGGVMMTTFGTGTASQTVGMQDIDTLIWSMSMIRATRDPTNAAAAWPDLPHPAMECALYYCVNSYDTVVENGVLQETATQVRGAVRSPGSWQMADPRFAGWFSPGQLSSIEFNGTSSLLGRTDLAILSPGNNTLYNISQAAVDTISSYLQSTFASDTREFNITDDGSVRGKLNGFSIAGGQYWPTTMQALSSAADFNQTFTSLAASMSNAIRDGADGADGGGGRAQGQLTAGRKGTLTTFYEVRWPWIALHCAILASGVAFFGITLSRNQSAPVWKSSSLAVLSRGHLVQDVVQGTQAVRQMERMAEGARVVLYSPVKVDGLEYDPLETACD
ncbi:hypothetical protein VMCG_09261 [Cytospora schulzeri]|uniref:Uncharacterized protein n=1 Tax=Cytospora schulzeri TaxID=448051 RepID=A0A423VKY6_9PEZI|nr:hypothetical protein VMCG_09261 [Valsa malicola]